MFAHRREAFKGLLTLVSALALIAFAGCGGESDETAAVGTIAAGEADQGDLEVIEGWSDTLREGDVRGAAGFFALPSVVQNGGAPLTIDSLADAIAFNRSLPCGAKVISAKTFGDLTRVTFRLSDRPGGDCGSGAGERASTLFDVEQGKIVEWRRLPAVPRPAPPGGNEGSVT